MWIFVTLCFLFVLFFIVMLSTFFSNIFNSRLVESLAIELQMGKANCVACLLYSRHCSYHFACLNSLSLHNNFILYYYFMLYLIVIIIIDCHLYYCKHGALQGTVVQNSRCAGCFLESAMCWMLHRLDAKQMLVELII